MVMFQANSDKTSKDNQEDKKEGDTPNSKSPQVSTISSVTFPSVTLAGVTISEQTPAACKESGQAQVSGRQGIPAAQSQTERATPAA